MLPAPSKSFVGANLVVALPCGHHPVPASRNGSCSAPAFVPPCRELVCGDLRIQWAMQPSRTNTTRNLLLAAALLLAGCGSACVGPGVRGSFDRTLEVSGPVRLFLTNGSGWTRVATGPSGQVRIHADFRVRAWLWENPTERVNQLRQNPPIRQQGSFLYIGFERAEGRGVSVDYTIEAPPDTQVRLQNGSGDLTVAGLAGPVDAATGSGNVTLNQISGDVRATAGSGDVHLGGIKGTAEITTGSGDVGIASVGGRVRVTSGSGDITLTAPGAAVVVRNGSGDIRVSGASSDVTIHSGSGDLAVSGSPAAGAYWELHTGSGDVGLSVPTDASFRFFAQTRHGDIRSTLRMTVLEQQSHELRAVLGQGSARVEVETGTGDVRVNASR